jgi:ADP-heptose:LPS heptosyltransferase
MRQTCTESSSQIAAPRADQAAYSNQIAAAPAGQAALGSPRRRLPRSFNAAPAGLVPQVRKIAVLRANGIGDLLFTLPALEALRRAYPSAEIVLLGRPWHRDFLAGRPGPIDRVEVVPVCRGIREEPGRTEDETEISAFYAAMQSERFDLALQMHGGGRNSNPFVRRLGARITAGFKTPDAEPLDRWIPHIFFASEVLRFLELAALVGCAETAVLEEPRLQLVARDHAEAMRSLPEGPLVALNPGAGDSRRRWPTAKFAAVGDALASRGATVLLCGSAGDKPLCADIARRMHAHPWDYAGRLSLGGLAALLSRCRVLVSNDSGPLHLGRAVGTPTVGLYWCGNLITAGPLTTAFHRCHLSWRLDCPVCGKNCMQESCEHRESFVDMIDADSVTATAIELFEAAGDLERFDARGELEHMARDSERGALERPPAKRPLSASP